MEENNMISKKLWNTMKVVYFMLKKGGLVSKRKLTVDLNLIMKRGKIATKTLTNLIMLHHHQNSNDRHRNVSSFNSHDDHDTNVDYHELISTSTGNNNISSAFSFQLIAKRVINYYSHVFACTHAPPTEDPNDGVDVNAVKRVLDMLNANDQMLANNIVVRQVRVTDSPFPLNNVDDDDHKVDEAAEEFIAKFYKKLKKQSIIMSPSSSSSSWPGDIYPDTL